MTLDTGPLVLEAPGVRAVVLPADGGRLGSLAIDGRELLVSRRPKETQSGPPDGPNQAPEVVTPGAPLTHLMRWRWTRL